ncbi:MAG: CBS domain-containing protein [Candidatus Heimdallarchaeota archaeon]
MKVADVMTKDPLCVSVPGTRADLFELISNSNQTSFPVIKTETDELIGIVTETDIVNKPSETQTALLMTKEPMTTTPKALISDIIKILIKNNFRQLPVIVKKKVVGMITIGDIISKVIAISASENTIENFMTSSVLALWQETPINICQKIISYAEVEAAIVFDNEMNMVGIITNIDFVKTFDSKESEKRDEMTAGEGKEGSWDAVSTIIVRTKDLVLPREPVKEIMAKDVITTFKKATISDVAKKMHRNSIFQLPVVDAKGNVVGMIRDSDLLKAFEKNEKS